MLQIGRRNMTRSDRISADENPRGLADGGDEVSRDTRVVWHVNQISGRRELRYEYVDRAWDLAAGGGGQDMADLDQPLMNRMNPGWRQFGAGDDDTPRLGPVVPPEFHEAALARATAAWGRQPDEMVLDKTGRTSRRAVKPTPPVDQTVRSVFLGD